MPGINLNKIILLSNKTLIFFLTGMYISDYCDTSHILNSFTFAAREKTFFPDL